MKKTTIQDVADYCHVAKSTVSLVLNGHSRVSLKTREKIFEAIRVLDYKPNLNAKNLKTNHNRTLGLIADDLSNLYATSIIKGVVQRSKFYNYDLFICECDWSQENVMQYLDMLAQRNCEGIIFTTPMDIRPQLTKKLENLKHSRIPCVVILSGDIPTPISAVQSDDAQGTLLALRHLVELGHTRIAFIAGFKGERATIAKERMYREYLESLGYYDSTLIYYTDFQPEQGFQAAKACLALNNPPTAFFASGDALAMGVLAGVKSTGYSVPQQISVVGYGGLDLAAYTDPPLTTVAVPRFTMGEMAVDNIINRIGDIDEDIPTVQLLKTELIVLYTAGPRA